MSITGLRYLIGQQIGLPAAFNGSIDDYRNLTPAQQIALTQGMIAYIKAHPESFTAAQVETATIEAPRAATMGLQDTSFDVDLFFQEFEAEALGAAGSIGQIGQGVLTSFEWVGKLLPFAVVAGLLILAAPYLAPHLKRALKP